VLGYHLHKTELTLEQLGVLGYFEERAAPERGLENGQKSTFEGLVNYLGRILEILTVQELFKNIEQT
jgi:hypothetical protein